MQQCRLAMIEATSPIPTPWVRARRFRRSRVLDGAALLLGVISFWHVHIVGELYVVELLSIILFLLLWPKKNFLLFQKPVRYFLFLGSLWLLSQIVTDLYRGTPWEDLARGWAAIGMFFLLFSTVLMLVSNDVRRAYLLLFGTAIGEILQQFLQPSIYFEAEPWKFGFGSPLALLLLSFLGWRYWRKRNFPLHALLLIIAFGGFSMLLNARSLGGFMILTGLLVWFRFTVWGRFLTRRRPSLRQVLGFMLIGLLSAFVVIRAYEFAVTHGWLGEKALAKYEMQATGKLGLIIGGRVELIPAVFAVMDSPILGHGSWAKDPRYRDYLWLLLNLGYGRTEAQIEYAIEHSDLIPTHSHILQAWVWAGFLGAVFWAYVLILIVRVLYRSYWTPSPLFVLLVFLGLHGIWDIFFSPFGSSARFSWALTLTILISSMFNYTIKCSSGKLRHSFGEIRAI